MFRPTGRKGPGCSSASRSGIAIAWRRTLDWGGEYGWHSWSYGPAERRYGRGGATARGTIEGPIKNVEGGTSIRRGPPVTGPKGGDGEIKDGGQMQKSAAPAGGRQGGNQGGG